MKYYLYNPLSNNGIKPEVNHEMIDATNMDYKKFFDGLKKDDEVVLVGGDGTINRFANEMYDYDIKNNVYLFGAGTGNDFLFDLGYHRNDEVLVNKYLKNLPKVKVHNIEKRFLNNMGLGIDGYCCEVADQIKEKNPSKKINYTAIAIKGLLFHFKPRHVEIDVDGKHYSFDNAWLAPTMKGRFYGGGMMMAPNQDRLSDTVTVVVYACKSKLKSLINFPSIFKGEHVRLEGMTHVMTGKKVHVKFQTPSAAQIDGETVLNVTEYDVEMD